MESSRALQFLLLLIMFAASCSFSGGSGRKMHIHNGKSTLEMKKGRGGGGSNPFLNRRTGGGVPRKKLKEVKVMKEKMEKEKAERIAQGMPAFKIFAAYKRGGEWKPCAEMFGDQKSAALVKLWMNGFMGDMSKKMLDQGVAKSLFTNNEKFIDSVVANFPPIGGYQKLSKEEAMFGYTIEYPGLKEKKGEQQVTLLKEEMTFEKGWFEKLKDSVISAIKEITTQK